jgi:hypothetical protein
MAFSVYSNMLTNEEEYLPPIKYQTPLSVGEGLGVRLTWMSTFIGDNVSSLFNFYLLKLPSVS